MIKKICESIIRILELLVLSVSCLGFSAMIIMFSWQMFNKVPELSRDLELLKINVDYDRNSETPIIEDLKFRVSELEKFKEANKAKMKIYKKKWYKRLWGLFHK